MRKLILALLLCSPLLWTARQTAEQLFRVSNWSMSKLATSHQEAGGNSELERLAKMRSESDALVNLPDEFAASIVRLESSPTGTTAKGPLAEALREHLGKRAKSHAEIENARLNAAKTEKNIRDKLEEIHGEDGRPRNRRDKLVELNAELIGYEKLPVYDAEILASARAEHDWPECAEEHPESDLVGFYEALGQWSPGKADARIQSGTVLDGHIDAYRKYIENHGSAKGAVAVSLVREARERLLLWTRGKKLAALIQGTAEERVNQVAAIIEMTEDNPPPRFEKTARQLVQNLCHDVLKLEPLDDKVLVLNDQTPPELFPRGRIQIRWKDETTVPLDKSGFDEYSLPSEKVENFFMKGGYLFNLPKDPTVRPLRGTEYSDAVRAFNVERARVQRWSLAELNRLRELCEPHKEVLSRGAPGSGGPTLIARIDALRDIVRRHPNVFVASAP